MIGVVGLGNMGFAIASRLISEGEKLTVWNRSAHKADGLTGARVVATPSDVVQASDIILCVLANDEATEAAYFSEHGILSTDNFWNARLVVRSVPPWKASCSDWLVVLHKPIHLQNRCWKN